MTDTEAKQENLSPPRPLSLSSSLGAVVLAQDTKLPAHLLELLEEWHKEHPTEPAPPNYHPKNRFSSKELLSTTKVFSRQFQEIPGCIEVTVEKPLRYRALWLPIPDGDKNGVFVKILSWGSNRSFLKKWRGGIDFQDEPVAVRQPRQLDGSFGEAPSKKAWEEATRRSLPSIGTKKPERSSNAKRRRSESDDEQSSSSGEDIPASSGPSKQLKQSIKASKKSRPSAGSAAYRDTSSSLSELDDSDFESEIDSESEEDESPESTSRRPSNGPSSNQKHLQETAPEPAHSSFNNNNNNNNMQWTGDPRHSSPNIARLSTQPARQSHIGTLTPLTATGSVQTPNSDNRSGRNGIRFKLVVPRLKMVRDMRVEDDEDTPEYLFNQTKDFFRRYDRLIGTPVLECVVDGEMECRCIYNAKELGYFIEELRERGGPIKVIVTQSA